MRLSSFVCAALAAAGLAFGVASSVEAADPKGKKKGGSSGDSLADDKVIGKQLQWENQVMGSDDGKKAELEKILRAQAINKAAQEKAEREREKAEKEKAAKEAAAARQQPKKSGEVALPTLPDEEPASSGKGKSKATEVAPEMETAVATPPPPPAKPADDKFIDKLLREEGGGKKKKASAAPDDKELIDILAGDKKDKPADKSKKAKKDSVDALLLEADKEPAAPAPKVKKETPEWAKPEIQSVPTPAPVAVRPPPVKKEDDGVIRVVQGAAPSGRAAAVPAAARTAPPPAPLVPASRKQAAASSSGDWDDPFAEPARKAGPAKGMAARHARSLDDEEAAPPRRGAATPISKREAGRSAAPLRAKSSSDWDDPFTDGDRKAAPRRGAPAAKPSKSTKARGGRWDDPFTAAPDQKRTGAPVAAKRTASKTSARIVVSKRAPAGKLKAKPAALAMHDGAGKTEGSKWSATGRRGSVEVAAATSPRWGGVLKKR